MNVYLLVLLLLIHLKLNMKILIKKINAFPIVLIMENIIVLEVMYAKMHALMENFTIQLINA